MTIARELLRHLPSVDKLLATAPVVDSLSQLPRWVVVQEARGLVADIRAGHVPLVTDKEARKAWFDELGLQIAERARRAHRYSLKRVLNATGVVLHTNMGRALLAPQAIEHLVETASRYSNLELNLDTGERGSRYAHVRDVVCSLTGAEDALVVNNNAAAVVLCLSELAAGREVITSRGELVEIGGSFRIPEIMKQSGCRLVEVGTTNRAHLIDYERAIGEDTALLLKVHTSNFRIVGFTSSVPVTELRALADQHALPIVHDLGAGCLLDLRKLNLPHEPTVQEALEEGADLVTFSGDKLLGGPQLGVIAGRADLIARLKKHQLLRAFRVDKLTLAAFEATMRIYRDSRDPIADLPSLRMLSFTAEDVRSRAEPFAASLQDAVDAEIRVFPGSSQVGAGSAPGVELPTTLVGIRSSALSVTEAETELRTLTPPVMVRVHDGEMLIDLRTVAEDEEPALIAALTAVFARG